MLLTLVWWQLAAAAVTAVVSGVLLCALWQQRGRALEQAQKAQLEQHNQQLQQRLETSQLEQQELQLELATLRAQADQARQNAAEKISLLQRSEERLQKEFERLANRVLEQKSAQFEKSNQQSLAHTLAPLQQQIDSFRQQVAQQFTDETKERASLKQELTQLRDLNKHMMDEAHALTQALKGDSKQQGNWGEVVLARMLSQSGLREGHEYETQSQHRNAEGKAFKPDVIVHLPNEKDVVIDSKVSLTAYERYFNAAEDSDRKRALEEHVRSVRTHIKQLGNKSYQQLDGVRTLDYVLMFIPIEPAFLLAVDQDPDLISLALDNNIMLVSPTNLLVALRTVHNIWQYEYQSQNAQRIASDAARLYDKFVGFVDDMNKVKGALENTGKHLDGAFNKLSQGRGNLVSRVEKFRELGVQPGKKLNPERLLDDDD
ncbi:DNA recombination protein RmuC [Aliidiomarina minuta]|uniref:DNA recombination protein RmuC n=1 Tax=Aliidiomarina minuta TaxID=880057 RepID=A0A432W7M6_9GAMM|nr:DNA recombination protein RmuC [Aliidiomarina minuta]RUO26093.1 DNA recombination protein RmuC [Aliidiomarina minuta]